MRDLKEETIIALDKAQEAAVCIVNDIYDHKQCAYLCGDDLDEMEPATKIIHNCISSRAMLMSV